MPRPRNGLPGRSRLALVLLAALMLPLAVPAAETHAAPPESWAGTSRPTEQEAALTSFEDSPPALAPTRSPGGHAERQTVAGERAVAAHNTVPHNPFAHLGRRLGHDDAPLSTRHTPTYGDRSPPSR